MIKKKNNKDLSKLNTFGMKVRAACYLEYDNPSDLASMPWDELAKPLLQIGSGSNLLFCSDFPGTVMRSRIDLFELLQERSVGDDVYIRAGAGMEMDELCRICAGKGWWGLENLSGIPGTVGASAVQNVGAYGVEAGELIESVDCYDIVSRRFVTFSAADCAFAYRDSFFKHNKGRYVVVSVLFHLYRDFRPRLDYAHLQEEVERNAELIMADTDPYSPLLTDQGVRQPITPMLVRQTVMIIREKKLPAVGKVGSAGSFFKNPVVSAEQFAAICAVAAGKGAPCNRADGKQNAVASDSTNGGQATEGKGAPCNRADGKQNAVVCDSTNGGQATEGKGVPCNRAEGEQTPEAGKVPHYTLDNGEIKIPAAWLIDSCGLKGARFGGASLWHSQPLVIVNSSGNALPSDIIALENHIIDTVQATYGITLSPEVEHI